MGIGIGEVHKLMRPAFRKFDQFGDQLVGRVDLQCFVKIFLGTLEVKGVELGGMMVDLELGFSTRMGMEVYGLRSFPSTFCIFWWILRAFRAIPVCRTGSGPRKITGRCLRSSARSEFFQNSCKLKTDA